MNKTGLIKRLMPLVGAAVMLVNLLAPLQAQAVVGTLLTRSFNLSTPLSNTAATWTFKFNASGTTALRGMRFQVCTTAGTAFTGCTVPGSWVNTGATLGSVTNGGT